MPPLGSLASFPRLAIDPAAYVACPLSCFGALVSPFASFSRVLLHAIIASLVNVSQCTVSKHFNS